MFFRLMILDREMVLWVWEMCKMIIDCIVVSDFNVVNEVDNCKNLRVNIRKSKLRFCKSVKKN